ncbi:MAG TPA: 1-(5-phosphoribosyl)-5-[(5-phosphoribosylamino)methylideneamino]imidazole-4-carboxamide isomerase [Tissierellaceae bacterium]|nr:1-(5-phosphoribosyl)-5-[(5-phosphoribosylamino)methylideneamino]imidazole-4-carboxamide isomerase [Tissierellaceae bacterium]
MLIYPAIDIRDGKCVRLTQGAFDAEKIYFDNPYEVAKLWEEKGARILHIIDLDGALGGESKNLDAIQKIVETVDIPIQVGGGIRSIKAIERLMDIGVDRIILGTKALEDRDIVIEALRLYGEKVIIGIDAKDGYVAIEGWTKTSQTKALDFAKEMEALGVRTIIYTDIAKDGMLQGPNFKSTKELNDNVDIDIIASGGVASMNDLEILSQIGVAGAIVGKALYEGRIDLAQIKDGRMNEL